MEIVAMCGLIIWHSQVFMLQLEGAKRWRLHRCPTGALPRSYCWDYEEKDLGRGR